MSGGIVWRERELQLRERALGERVARARSRRLPNATPFAFDGFRDPLT